MGQNWKNNQPEIVNYNTGLLIVRLLTVNLTKSNLKWFYSNKWSLAFKKWILSVEIELKYDDMAMTM